MARAQTRTIMGTPADIGQRLAGQPGGRHAGGDQQDRFHVSLWVAPPRLLPRAIQVPWAACVSRDWR